jgi:multidrug efflux pump subunit AcrB
MIIGINMASNADALKYAEGLERALDTMRASVTMAYEALSTLPSDAPEYVRRRLQRIVTELAEAVKRGEQIFHA